MKKLLIVLMGLFILTACDLTENTNDKTIYTSFYPFEYATRYMYGNYSTISSIYPSGVDLSTYELTNKQKDLYSNADIFIYSGLDDEVKLAVDFLNTNSNLNLIDATRGLNYTNDISELWLNPSNYLMVARNIKGTLIDYESNLYNQDSINKLYDELKIEISELDVELTMISKNASRTSILIADDTLSFLSKYNLNVLSLNPNNENYSKSYNEAKRLIGAGDIKYIYVIKDKVLQADIESFIADNNLEKIEIDPMYTLSEEQRKNNSNYTTIMKENIDKLKTELFR